MMKLTESDKRICKKYSARDAEGFVHCNECPLRIAYNSNDYGLCKATATIFEWNEWITSRPHQS